MDAAVGDVLRIDLGDRVEGPGPGPIVFAAGERKRGRHISPIPKGPADTAPGRLAARSNWGV